MPEYNVLQRLTVLSPYFTIPLAEEVLANNETNRHEVTLLRDKKLHILSDLYGKVYLINPTIKAFLEAFKEPTTLEEVIDEFADISHSQPLQIQGAMQSFYDDMYKEGIIIAHDTISNYHQMMEEDSINSAHYKKGEHIGNYEVIEELSIRNASQLYLAKHPDQSDTVVIKTMIYPTIIPDKVAARSRRKFRQEFKLMESLGGHPNVCKLVELNESEHNPFAAIEHIKGESLRSYIKNNNLSIAKKTELIRQTLSAIAHVQNKRVIHGDIHLSNFLVNLDGQIKLIDFGLSNNSTLEKGEIKRNGGVYECIPPERVEMSAFSFLSQRADFRSEVFQLAVISYYILYREYPFLGFTWQELANKIKNEKVELSEITIEGEVIPPRILDMLSIAFRKNPALRFADAQHMLKLSTFKSY